MFEKLYFEKKALKNIKISKIIQMLNYKCLFKALKE